MSTSIPDSPALRGEVHSGQSVSSGGVQSRDTIQVRGISARAKAGLPSLKAQLPRLCPLDDSLDVKSMVYWGKITEYWAVPAHDTVYDSVRERLG